LPILKIVFYAILCDLPPKQDVIHSLTDHFKGVLSDVNHFSICWYRFIICVE